MFPKNIWRFNFPLEETRWLNGWDLSECLSEKRLPIEEVFFHMSQEKIQGKCNKLPKFPFLPNPWEIKNPKIFLNLVRWNCEKSKYKQHIWNLNGDSKHGKWNIKLERNGNPRSKRHSWVNPHQCCSKVDRVEWFKEQLLTHVESFSINKFAQLYVN